MIDVQFKSIQPIRAINSDLFTNQNRLVTFVVWHMSLNSSNTLFTEWINNRALWGKTRQTAFFLVCFVITRVQKNTFVYFLTACCKRRSFEGKRTLYGVVVVVSFYQRNHNEKPNFTFALCTSPALLYRVWRRATTPLHKPGETCCIEQPVEKCGFIGEYCPDSTTYRLVFFNVTQEYGKNEQFYLD